MFAFWVVWPPLPVSHCSSLNLSSRRLFSQLEVQAHRLVHVRDEPDPASVKTLLDKGKGMFDSDFRESEKGEVLLRGVGTLRYLFILG